MKRTMLHQVERLRYFALLLVMALGATTASALESDDINAAILTEGSLVVKWTDGSSSTPPPPPGRL